MIDHETKARRFLTLRYDLRSWFGKNNRYAGKVYITVAEMWDEAFELGLMQGMRYAVGKQEAEDEARTVNGFHRVDECGELEIKEEAK